MQNQAWSIGRIDSNKCDILLQGETISSIHATLSFLHGKFYIMDNGSTNGTNIIRSNKIISISEHTEIFPSDRIQFGLSEYAFDDLIDFSINTKGVHTESFIIVNGFLNGGGDNREVDIDNFDYSDNSKMDEEEYEDEKYDEEEKHTPPPINEETKKIRCVECSTVIPINETCYECGSNEHKNMKD